MSLEELFCQVDDFNQEFMVDWEATSQNNCVTAHNCFKYRQDQGGYPRGRLNAQHEATM